MYIFFGPPYKSFDPSLRFILYILKSTSQVSGAIASLAVVIVTIFFSKLIETCPLKGLESAGGHVSLHSMWDILTFAIAPVILQFLKY